MQTDNSRQTLNPQLTNLKKSVREHKLNGKLILMEEQLQLAQQEVEEKYQHTTGMLKKMNQETVAQLKRAIEEQDKQPEENKHTIKEKRKQLLHEKPPAAMSQKMTQDMRWDRETTAPKAMYRGSVASDSNMVYFNSDDSTGVYSYNTHTREWSQLPDALYTWFALVVVQGKLTTVGGFGEGGHTDSLLSLMGKEGHKKWLPHYPAMPTKRWRSAAVCYGHSLIVAGGNDGLYTVEVMDTDTKWWYIANSLISRITNGTISVCGERLYINNYDYQTSSAFTCFIPKLLQSCEPRSLAGKKTPAIQSTVWQRIANPPCAKSSFATLCGKLVAVGGYDEHGVVTGTTAVYNDETDSWEAVEDMPTARSDTLVATLNEKMIVVGGSGHGARLINVVEVLH